MQFIVCEKSFFNVFSVTSLYRLVTLAIISGRHEVWSGLPKLGKNDYQS